MKIYTFKFTQKLPAGLDKAWEFFSSPFNLTKITPSLGFVITSDLSTEQKMYPGILISYTVAPLFGVKMNWLTEITHIEEKKYFVDEQRFGPFALWHHQHHFKEVPGGILMEDILNYAIPYGFIGKIVNKIIVQDKILDIFKIREQKIKEVFPDNV